MSAIFKIALIFLGSAMFLQVQGQDQSIADSLISVYQRFSVEDTVGRLEVLRGIANNHNDPNLKLEYARKLIESARQEENFYYLFHGYLNEGQSYRLLGDFEKAIYSLFEAMSIAEEDDYNWGKAAASTALADVYSILGNGANAIMYYKEAMQWLTGKDSVLLAITLLNMGDEYYMSAKYDSALICFQQSRAIYNKLGNDPSGLAYNLGNIGLVQAELGNIAEAQKNVATSIRELEALGDHNGSAIFLGYLAEICKKNGLLKKAEIFADSAMAISGRYGLKAEVRDNSLRLAEIYALSSDFEKAYNYHRQYLDLKDSISNYQIINHIESLQSEVELAKKQSEVDVLKERHRNQQVIMITTTFLAIILTILAIVIFSYYRSKVKTNKILEDQKRSLESLNETKDKFFSIISHDLRGPISSFHGVSRLIKFLVKSKDMNQLLEITDDIDNSVDQITGLLDNLLSWAMQQQGRFSYIPEKVSLGGLVSELLKTLTGMAEAKRITMINEVNDNIALWSDRNTTTTILRNLVSNALKFTPMGGTVRLSARMSSTYAEVYVSDSGIGIPQAKVEQLFELQYRKSTFGTDGEKGLGLGLQLVKEFVEMNNGSVGVSSEEGEGTTFVIKLPLFEVAKVTADS